MIHVCFGLHDADGKYSKFIGASMASIFENTSAPVTIHILHDATLTNVNRDKFSYLAGRYGQHVIFHNVEENFPDELAFIREKLADKIGLRFSIGAFYRLLIKHVLGTGKAIYLDADIIVNLDIAELWRQDLQNFPLAAVPEADATFNYMITDKFLLNSELVKQEDYFCSGVLLLNLNAFDENFFRDGVQFLVDNPDCESPDQDILNAFFAKNYLKLEQKFDSFAEAERWRNASVANKIYHYAGLCIALDTADPFNRLFLENFTRTPWFDLDIFSGLSEVFQLAKDEYTLRFQQMLKDCIEHRRALFVEPHNVQVAKILLSLQDDEQIIEGDIDEPLDELITKMREQSGQTIFFICRNDYTIVRAQLLANGFKEFTDFTNGLDFMTRPQSAISKPPGYGFIKAL